MACHKLWQVDAFVTIQDFGSGESGENMLNALKDLGFAPKVVYDIGANNGESVCTISFFESASKTKSGTSALLAGRPMPMRRR